MNSCEMKESSDTSQDAEMESQRAKVLSLERAIVALREELRESKDQNELLEFRLLEMEELGSSPPTQVSTEQQDEKRHADDLLGAEEAVMYGAEVRSEPIMNSEDYDNRNSHSSVAESRSSCSECSETLSFPESGIFEHHEESRSGSGSRNEEVENQLSILRSQIQSLVFRFAESNESPRSTSRRKRGSLDSSNDLFSELKFCTEQVEEFERRLSKWPDVAYVTGLEDKVATLLCQKRDLEEERAEMEEAENDIRHECQRLEKKKTLLQHQLSTETHCTEQLRLQVLHLEEREAELMSQMSQTDALAQSHEQRNFELEEAHIQLKEALSICQKEKRDLQEKWIRLIKELEQFEVFLQTRNSDPKPCKINKIREGTLVANRIRTLFPDERVPNDSKSETLTKPPPPQPEQLELSLVKRLEQNVTLLLEQREKPALTQTTTTTKFQVPEKQGEIDRKHLLDENARLESQVAQLEEEVRSLNLELIRSNLLQKRLEEAQASEKLLRLRVDEFEQTQYQFSEILSQTEKKDRKNMESLSHLREEVTFLHNKCCQVQDELETKTRQEIKTRSEVQALNLKVRVGQDALEQKEKALAEIETLLQAQISKLEVQVKGSQKALSEAECSNGMLREEVSYLERTMRDLAQRLNVSDKKVLLLKSDLEAMNDTHTQKCLNQNQGQESAHDLDVFAKNEGGLVGVAREVHEVMSILKKCGICKQSAAHKLTEVSDQLNTLTQMLGGELPYRNERQLPDFLLRCESDEHLSDTPPPIPIRRDRSIRRPETKKAQLAPFIPITDRSNVVQLKIKTDPRTITYL